MLIKRNKHFSAIEEEEYLDQKEFNSKAQKALRRKWEASEGKNYLKPRDSDFMKSLLDGKADQIAKKDLTTEASINRFRRESKFGGASDRLAENARASKDTLKELRELDLQSYKNGKIRGKVTDYKKLKLGNSPWDLGQKRGYDEQVLAAEKRAARAAKEKASKDSIAHHQEIANALKKKKVTNIAKKSALGAAALVGTGVVAKKLYDRKKKKNADQGNK